MSRYKAESMLLMMTMIWGATFLFTKLGLKYTTPFAYVSFRFGIALVLTLVFFSRHLKGIDKEVIRQGMMLGVLFAGGFMLQTAALEMTSISKTAFITGLTVTVTPFVSFFLVKKKISAASKAGVVIATAGLYVFTDPDIGNINTGDLIVLVSTVFWALYITLVDRYTKDKDEFRYTIQMIAVQFVTALMLSGSCSLLFDRVPFGFAPDTELLYSLAFNAVIASFLVLLIHLTYQKYTTPVRAALIFSLEPLAASFFAWLALSEVLNSRETAGAAIMMSGVAVSEFGPLIMAKFRRGEAV